MRALTIVYILLACTVAGFTQTTATYDNVRARQQLTLNGHTLTSVLQTIDSLSTHAQGVTAKAVYDYIATKYSTVSAGTGIDVVKAGSNYTISLDTLKRLHFRTDSTYSGGVGTMRWNLTDGTLDLGLLGGNVTLQLGQESVQRVKHADNSGLVQGKVVYLVGSDGTNPTVRYARANTDLTSANTFGVMTEDASGGSKAFCTTFGLVRNINTNNLTEGGLVWLSKDTAGAMTAVRPTAPNHGVEIGFCIRKHATQGVVFVTVQNGYELNELHDVYAPSPSNNQGLLWKSANSRWEAAIVDTSMTNEGILGVGAGTGGSAIITSNTSGANGVSIQQGNNISIGEVTSSNGGMIQISTNAGLLGVGAGTSTTSVITSNTVASTGVTLAAGTGMSISETTSSNGGSITLTNSSPDQTVSISNGGGVGVTGSYPSFTLTATDQSITNEIQRLDTFSLSGQTLRASLLNDGVAASSVTLPVVNVTAGTGVSVSNATGNYTVTNSAPDQTISLTNGGGVGVTGTYPSFTLTATDQSASNEGTLGVGEGTSSSSVITSNTSGASGVTLNAGGGISISETTSSNGGSITLSATDQSITNEGILGVAINPGADAWLRSNTSTANDIGIVGTNNTTINATVSINGGQIVIDSKAQIDTFSVSGSTLSLSLKNDGQAAKTVTLPGGGGGGLSGVTGYVSQFNSSTTIDTTGLFWNGRLGINTASPSARLDIVGEGITSGTNAIEINNSARELFKIANNGAVTIGKNDVTTTQNTASITSSGTDANIGIAIVPKGTGAITAQIPDGTTTGGNARGANAIDFQTSRTTAAQVASGSKSFAIGENCTASGATSFVGGLSSSASNDWTFAFGRSCVASGSRSTAFGNSTASGDYSFAGGVSQAVSLYSTAFGTARSYLTGQISTSSGDLGERASAQSSTTTVMRRITGTGSAELTLEGAAPSSTTKLILTTASPAPTNGRLWNAIIQLSAICTTAGGTVTVGESFIGEYNCGIKRIGNTTSLVGTVQNITAAQSDTNMSTSVVTITADDTNESLKIEFTPPSGANASTVIRVVATVYLTEVGY